MQYRGLWRWQSSNAPICDGNDINFVADNLAGGQGSGNTYQWYDPTTYLSSSAKTQIYLVQSAGL